MRVCTGVWLDELKFTFHKRSITGTGSTSSSARPKPAQKAHSILQTNRLTSRRNDRRATLFLFSLPREIHASPLAHIDMNILFSDVLRRARVAHFDGATSRRTRGIASRRESESERKSCRYRYLIIAALITECIPICQKKETRKRISEQFWDYSFRALDWLLSTLSRFHEYTCEIGLYFV